MRTLQFKMSVIITAVTAFAVIAVACIGLGGPPAIVAIAGGVLARMLGTALAHVPSGRDAPPALPE